MCECGEGAFHEGSKGCAGQAAGRCGRAKALALALTAFSHHHRVVGVSEERFTLRIAEKDRAGCRIKELKKRCVLYGFS